MKSGMPPLSERVENLIVASTRAPIRDSPRRRLMWAFNLIASGEWDRVLVQLNDDDLEALERSGNLISQGADVPQVIELAETLASAYSFSTTDIGHVAVSLALTMVHNDRKAYVVRVMGEIFGLGTLEDIDKVVQHHYNRMEQQATAIDNGISNTSTDSSARWHARAIIIPIFLRFVALIGLLVLAVQGGHWFGYVAALSPLIATRDPRYEEPRFGEPASLLEINTRWPWLLIVSLICTVLNLDLAALTLLILAASTEAISIWGEAALATGMYLEGPRSAVLSGQRRISSIVDSYVAFRRERRLKRALNLSLLQLPFLGLVALMSAFLDSWVASVTIMMLVARKQALLGLVGLGMLAAFDDWSFLTCVLVLCGGVFAQVLIGLEDAPPRLRIPLPTIPSALLGWRQARILFQARRDLHRGRPESAIKSLQAGRGADFDDATALLAWAQLTCGRPGAAKASAALLPLRFEGFRLLVFAVAELDLSNVVTADMHLSDLIDYNKAQRPSRSLYAELRFTKCRILAERRTPAAARDLLQQVPMHLDRENVYDAMRILRLAASCWLKDDPSIASTLAGLGFGISRIYSNRFQGLELALLDSARPILLEGSRCAFVMALADTVDNGVTSDLIETLGTREGLVSVLLQSNRQVDAAITLNEAAETVRRSPQLQREALNMRLEAIAVLNGVRHGLEDRTDRENWWAALGSTLDAAMEQAAEANDWLTLAELIETARFQQVPELRGQQVPPHIRVRGSSQLEECAWYEAGVQAQILALEDLAESVLGAGTIWWSSWTTSSKLFWSVVPPEGDVYGGYRELESDGLQSVLRDLTDALPIPMTDEPSDEFKVRSRRSPLNSRSNAESYLSAKLGSLIPPPIVSLLQSASSPVSIALAPASILGSVPWSSIILPGTYDTRLIERALVAIAPPAALIHSISQRRETLGSSQLGFALLNPTGELPAAEKLKPLFPSDAVVLTSGDVPSLSTLADRLKRVPNASTAVFACHTEHLDDTPGGYGLLIANPEPGKKAEVLTIDALTRAGEFALPDQAMLLACASSNLINTMAGEWLVLGTATLWAGARRTIVTSFPIFDYFEFDEAILSRIIAGHEMHHALRQSQLQQLEIMRNEPSTDIIFGLKPGGPILWGGHISLGAFGPAGAIRTLRSTKAQYVAQTVVNSIDEAAAVDGAQGRHSCTVGALVAELVLRGYHEPLSAKRRSVISVLGYTWYFSSLLRGWILGTKEFPASLSDELRQVLETAAVIARTASHKVISVDHVMVAILQLDSRVGKVCRVLTGWDARLPEIAKELLSEVDGGHRSVGLPLTKHLSDKAIHDIYTAVNLNVPDRDDRNHRVADL